MTYLRPVLIALLLLTACSAAPSSSGPSATATERPTPESTPVPTERPSPTPSGPGKITFGIGLSDDLIVELIKSSFAVGDLISLSADFNQPAGATSLDLIISSRDASGAETVVYTESISVADPAFDLFGIEDFDLSSLVDNQPGTYVLRYYRDATMLAEGEFTLT